MDERAVYSTTACGVAADTFARGCAQSRQFGKEKAGSRSRRRRKLASLRSGMRGRPPYTFALVLVVLIRLIHSEPAEFVGDFEQVLVALVPLGAHLAQKHRSLVRPPQLEIPHFADVRPQPAGILHVVAVGELRVGQA